MGKVLQAKTVDPFLSKPENMDCDEMVQIEIQGQGSPVQDFDKSSNSLFDMTPKSDLMDESDEKRIRYMETQEDQLDKKTENEENLINLSNEDSDLARTMFGNHLILTKILEHLPSKELLKFRLVNKMWEEESTRLALKRRSISIGFRFEIDSRIHIVPHKKEVTPSDHNHSNNNNNYTLDKLNELLETSRCFPFGYFYFNGGDLSSVVIQEFLGLQGNNIRNLELNLKMSPSSLKNLILNQAPRIEQLVLKRITEEWTNQGSSFSPQQQIALPNLKYIYFNKSCPLILEIIQASPNLRKIDGDVFQLLENPIILKRSQVIRNLVINVDPLTINLELFAKEKPQLEHLGLFAFTKTTLKPLSKYHESRFPYTLSKILESSSTSLNGMEISLKSEYFVGVEWPKLEKVQQLIIRQSRSSPSFHLPSTFLTTVVPNIVSLSLHFSRQGQTTVLFSLLSLKPEEKLVHLKKVSLKYGLVEILRKLLRFAPNLEELAARFIPSLPSIKNYIWGFKQLKKLDLGILVAPLMLNNLFPHVDHAFTGLSEKTICDLQNPKYFEEMKGKEISREGLSILNCKDLQHLRIRVIPARMHLIDISVPSSPNRKISCAVGEFGFKKLPNLNVEISVDAGTHFDVNQLSPYAKIIIPSTE